MKNLLPLGLQAILRRIRYGIPLNEAVDVARLLRTEPAEDLIRIGSGVDGGYLIPNDIEGIVACFSPGVGPSADFEMDIWTRFSIRSFLADFSVDHAPIPVPEHHFLKRFVGNSDDDARYISLDRWIEEMCPGNGDLMLQMDIEGAEYEVIDGLSERNLSRFRIMAIEFHRVNMIDDIRLHHVIKAAFEKLLTTHRVVHIHPNNAGRAGRIAGHRIPELLEVTFLRRDRPIRLRPHPSYPHPLDRPNLPERPDMKLPAIFYKV